MSFLSEYDPRADIAYQLTPEERRAIAEAIAGGGRRTSPYKGWSESRLRNTWAAGGLTEDQWLAALLAKGDDNQEADLKIAEAKQQIADAKPDSAIARDVRSIRSQLEQSEAARPPLGEVSAARESTIERLRRPFGAGGLAPAAPAAEATQETAGGQQAPSGLGPVQIGSGAAKPAALSADEWNYLGNAVVAGLITREDAIGIVGARGGQEQRLTSEIASARGASGTNTTRGREIRALSAEARGGGDSTTGGGGTAAARAPTPVRVPRAQLPQGTIVRGGFAVSPDGARYREYSDGTYELVSFPNEARLRFEQRRAGLGERVTPEARALAAPSRVLERPETVGTVDIGRQGAPLDFPVLTASERPIDETGRELGFDETGLTADEYRRSLLGPEGGLLRGRTSLTQSSLRGIGPQGQSLGVGIAEPGNIAAVEANMRAARAGQELPFPEAGSYRNYAATGFGGALLSSQILSAARGANVPEAVARNALRELLYERTDRDVYGRIDKRAVPYVGRPRQLDVPAPRPYITPDEEPYEFDQGGTILANPERPLPVNEPIRGVGAYSGRERFRAGFNNPEAISVNPLPNRAAQQRNLTPGRPPLVDPLKLLHRIRV